MFVIRIKIMESFQNLESRKRSIHTPPHPTDNLPLVRRQHKMQLEMLPNTTFSLILTNLIHTVEPLLCAMFGTRGR